MYILRKLPLNPFISSCRGGGTHLHLRGAFISSCLGEGTHLHLRGAFISSCRGGGIHLHLRGAFISSCRGGGTHLHLRGAFISSCRGGGTHLHLWGAFISSCMGGGTHLHLRGAFISSCRGGGTHLHLRGAFISSCRGRGTHLQCFFTIGIDHDAVCAGVVGTAIRTAQVVPAVARPLAWTSAVPDSSTNHDSADRISGQFLFYHNHNFTNSKGNLRFQRPVPLFVSIGVCVTKHDDGTASDVTIGMWRHNQQATNHERKGKPWFPLPK